MSKGTRTRRARAAAAAADPRPAEARPTEAHKPTALRGGRRHGAQRRGGPSRLILTLAGAGAFAIAAFIFVRPGTVATIPPPVPYASPVRGESTAPVTIVEYADFQCPSCGAFFRSAEPRLVNEYVKTGKAKLVFKNFAWIGEESRRAAEAAACAGAQGKFWEYHDTLYSSQRGENQGAFSVNNLKAFAARIGLDQASFDACIDGRAYKAAVDADMNEVRQQGFNGTPTFTINGTRIVGAQDYGVFARTIDAKLAGR